MIQGPQLNSNSSLSVSGHWTGPFYNGLSIYLHRQKEYQSQYFVPIMWLRQELNIKVSLSQCVWVCHLSLRSKVVKNTWRYVLALSLGKPSLKKNKKDDGWHLSSRVDKLFFYFFSSTRPFLGHFWKNNIFCPLKSVKHL